MNEPSRVTISLLTSHWWQYIKTFTTRRRRLGDSDSSIVTSIDDVRNGLLVHPTIHRTLGRSIAFLKVSLFDLVLDLIGS